MHRRLAVILCLLLLVTTACAPAGLSIAPTPASSLLGHQATGAPALSDGSTSTPFPLFASTSTVASLLNTDAPQPPTVTAATESRATAAATDNAPAPGGILKVTYVDVGQGDSTLITTPDGKNILIDGGEADQNISGKLKSMGVTSLDTIFATHAHSDHIGGLPAVIESIKTGQVVMNGLPYTTKTFENLIDAISQKNVGYKEVKRGDQLTIGGVNFLVLNPAGDLGDDQNNNSVVLLATYKKASFLFMGDAEHDAESSIMGSGLPVKADILKAGHHCSSTSSSPAFVDKVRPMIAVCFVGAGNTYGHPHKETLATYASRKIPLYVTEYVGSVTVTTDGATYKVETKQNGVVFSSLAVGGAAPVAPGTIVPTSKPASSPAATAAVTPQAGGAFDLKFSAEPGSVKAGGRANVGVQTAPSANCVIVVTYKSGPSKAQGLEPKTADGSGNVSWAWNVGSSTTAGSWPVDVKCSAGGASKSIITQLTVTK